MRFDILTIFPSIFDSYLNESMMKRAQAKKLVDIRVHDVRKFSTDRKHKKVDDRPYGGGPGMVLKIEPIIKAIESILKQKGTRLRPSFAEGFGRTQQGYGGQAKIILFSAAGKQFDQKMAGNLAKKYNNIIMVAGHYEGVDERLKKVIKDTTGIRVEEISIGPYTLTGGELPAMVVIDAVSRHVPGFLGKAESLEETRYGIGLPAYTRPEVFEYEGKRYRVPKVLLSGDHKKIEEWRNKST